MKNLISFLTTSKKVILVDISDEACLKYGFLHGDIAIHPKDLEVKIVGVAPSNDGQDTLYYEIDHNKTRGMICYYGKGKNLIEAGFVRKEDLIEITHLVLNNFPKDGKKQKVFFVVKNAKGKFYWGTDDHDLDPDVILSYVESGILKELKVPIFIKKGQGLWCEGENISLYVGDKNPDGISFSDTPFGKFKDLVIA